MEFRALGPVELWSAGERQDLGSGRTRSILAMLLLAPRVMIPVETLIDRMWDERPPAKARESLSVYVARLRASLRQAVGDDVRLVGRTQGGYLLDVDPETIDVHRFRRLRQEAAAFAVSGDYDDAAQLLREADGLWRGEALGGIGGDWMARMRDALEEERRAAVLERITCELELGQHAALTGELGQLLTKYPLDETLVAHQMTALYAIGRPADALSLYRETRRRLVEEQGTEPGPGLADLHQRILDRDAGLAPGHLPGLRIPSSLGTRRAAVEPPDTLPPAPAQFVGRDEELRLLTGQHGVTPGIAVIEGMPGVGKTALAVRTAHLVRGQYPDGALYLDLRCHDPAEPPLDPAEALHRLLRMMSVPAIQIPPTIGQRSALWRALLSRRRVVVILDDAAGHDQIRPLLPTTGRSLLLVTTRRRLPDVGRARSLSLGVLPAEEAITLFQRMAGLSRGGDTDQVATVVRLCGRLPLAIEVAARRPGQGEDGLGRRTGGGGPPDLDGLVEDLSRPPAWLADAGAVSLEVMAAFDLSYRALDPDHQRFFRRLAVSPCDCFSLPVAAAVAGCTLAEAEKALVTLQDCHLLARTPGGQFRFHDLVRGYAAARAARDDPATEHGQAVSRLLEHYQQAGRSARTDAARWLEAEWRNILQAARHAGRREWKRQCADLIDLLTDFMEINAYWDEAISAHTLALQASRDLGDPARVARAALALSVVCQQTGRHGEAIVLAEEAAAICQSQADRAGEAKALDQIGLAHQRTARSREALAYFTEAQILYRAAADPRGVADTLSHTGIACWHLGHHAEADARLREALALYRDTGDRRGEAKALNNLGRALLYNGYHRDALDAYHESLRIFQEIGGAQNEAILYHNIGTVHHYKGSYAEALTACRRALTIYRDIGDLPNEADVLNDIGAIYQSAACDDEALRHHQKARQISEELGNPAQQLIALRAIAGLNRGSGQHGQALDHYRMALRLAREVGDPYEEGKILEGMAESTLSTQGPGVARIVFRQALDIFERLGVPEAASVRIRLETVDPAYALRVS
jgi:DNA-binding SARP family transcriptional activator/tetratricopeptide (TPR) repeat protein